MGIAVQTEISSLGRRLKRAREALGYAQKGVAEAVGSKLRSWQDYEADKKVPGSQVIAGFVRLGVNANWVLTNEGPMLIKDLPQGTPGVLDRELLQLIIEAIETALEQAGRKMKPAKKAELILATYDIYSDSNTKPDSAKILNFIKSAV